VTAEAYTHRPVDQPAGVAAAFTEAMAHLASGVAVVTARQPDGAPCGLLISSVCSYSVAPPSVLIAVAEQARSYFALVGSTGFGVHLLNRSDTDLAGVFAGRGDDKFRHLRWSWDGPVPRIAGVGGYLRCAPSAVFHHGDHAIMVGEVLHCQVEAGEPLVYFGRRLGWSLAMADDQDRAANSAPVTPPRGPVGGPGETRPPHGSPRAR
jgi:flavin reductase (DIM6/NTAB) family NADH-FMN oxidoreductase RutF